MNAKKAKLLRREVRESLKAIGLNWPQRGYDSKTTQKVVGHAPPEGWAYSDDDLRKMVVNDPEGYVVAMQVWRKGAKPVFAQSAIVHPRTVRGAYRALKKAIKNGN